MMGFASWNGKWCEGRTVNGAKISKGNAMERWWNVVYWNTPWTTWTRRLFADPGHMTAHRIDRWGVLFRERMMRREHVFDTTILATIASLINIEGGQGASGAIRR